MYSFKVSSRTNKKYDVYKNGKYLTSFGDIRYQQYEDKTPLKYYSYLNHFDERRRNNYYSRFGRNPKFESALFFAHKYLW
jgi:hypothetical protein